MSQSDPNISRRALLLGGLSAACSLSALGGIGPLQRLARAAEGTLADDHYYIFCYFSGGWDILLASIRGTRRPSTLRTSKTRSSIRDMSSLRSPTGSWWRPGA